MFKLGTIILVFLFLLLSKPSYGTEYSCYVPQVSPSPSPLISPTPEPCKNNCSPPDSEHHDDVVYQPPLCVGGGTKQPTLILKGFDDNCVQFVYFQTDPFDHAVFRYGYDALHLEYGIPYLPNTSQEIEVCALDTTRHIWGQVGTEVNYCMSWSQIIDP